MTDFGKTLQTVIHAITKWEIHYRETVLIKYGINKNVPFNEYRNFQLLISKLISILSLDINFLQKDEKKLFYYDAWSRTIILKSSRDRYQ